jgi:ABC-type multidrug transport system fused ATPase/permease subunit
MREVWRSLSSLLSRRCKRRLGVNAVESFLAGLLEAILLTLVVAAALAVAARRDVIDLNMPVLGHLKLRPGSALIVAGIAGVVALAVHLHSALLTARLSADVLNTARKRAIAAYLNAAWARQSQEGEGALQETVSTLSSQTSVLVTYLSDFSASAFGLFALLFMAFVLDPLVALVVLLLGASLFIGTRPVGRLTQSRGRHYVAVNSRFVEQVSQWSGLAMELRVFGVEKAEAERLREHGDAASAALAKSRFVSRAGGELFRDLAILTLVGAVGALHLIGDVDLASVGAVVLVVVRCLSYAQRAASGLQMVNEQGPNLHAYISRVESLEAAGKVDGVETVEDVSAVQLHDVGYDYRAGEVAIDGITIDIAAGEAIGVIGPSGGGKSTLAEVLLRLRPATRGIVTVSGIPYERIHPASWSQLVALVSQDPKLFQGSVANNIAFFRPAITHQEIVQAAQAAHVFEDIRQLPNGFDTELEARGGGLSGGQKQRITIARALVGKPKLLVLDEPTSALDERSEQLLQQTIEELKGGVTLIIIAHRMSTLACCDRVVALDRGRIKVIGTLQEARTCMFGNGISIDGITIDNGSARVASGDTGAE